MKIALYGRNINEDHLPFMHQLIACLDQKPVLVRIYQPFLSHLQQSFGLNLPYSSFADAQELDADTDCLFSLGGDGAILDTILLVQDKGIPVLGINFGRLGFLSSVQHADVNWAINAMIEKKYSIDKRTLLQVHSPASIFDHNHHIALNDVTILKKDSSSMIQIHTWVNHDFFNTYWADGLIIATPTGSTGYSMSCNGPIIMPDTPSLALTPIAPHNLTMRPVIISDTTEIKLKVESRDSTYLLSLDSRNYSLSHADEIVIRKCPFQINFIKLHGMSHIQSLRNKLLWGVDKRN